MAAQNSLKVFTIGGRTDATPAAVNDTDQEEMRFGAKYAGRRQGLVESMLDDTPNPNAFRVRQNTGADMNIKIGNGVTTKLDGYVLRGTASGQSNYVVRLDAATRTITVPATDPTNPARYGVYLHIDDAAYAGTASTAKADLACIRGTPAGSPTTPAALAVWSAWALLWEFQLPALASAVTDVILDSATSFDRRVYADLSTRSLVDCDAS